VIEPLAVLGLGFVLGVRHAVDADHVVAVTAIVTRHRDRAAAAATGLLWGIGHSLTVAAVGSAIILFNLVIPPRVSLGLELTVGVMLVGLGLINITAYLRRRRDTDGALAKSAAVHSHAHTHGDYVHVHRHGHAPDAHPHDPARTPLSALDRRFDRSRLYRRLRPVIVGVVHGLAGSAAVTLLVVAAVGDPAWAIAYLVIFGVGTVAGMWLVTLSLASALRLASARSADTSHRIGLAGGLASVIVGLVFAYQVWSAGIP
jgi:high-affinity nickel-transport protein